MKSDFQRKVYTVSQIAVEIRDMIERKFLDIWVEGEISNFKSSTAGHLYFTLKDEKAQLPIGLLPERCATAPLSS